MKKSNILILASMITVWGVCGAGSSLALTVALNPVADTFITDGTLNGVSSTSNFGTLGAISVAGRASGNGGEYLALLKFSMASAVAQFDAEYGVGNWGLSSATLRLAGNIATEGAVPNNARFPKIHGGPFSIFWFSGDSWTETGVTYDNFSAGSVEGLGSHTYVPPGDNIPVFWTLGVAPGFVADVLAGGDLSLKLSPGDDTVSYLFNSRSYNNPGNFPVLSLTAVPEPAVSGFLVMGAVFLAAAVRRLCGR